MRALLRRAATRIIPLWLRRSIMLTKRTLVDTGYVRSVRSAFILDGEGRPLPWYTFPAIAYLESLELGDARVLEFGSGNSTLFWQRRSRHVVSVEHDVQWYETVRPALDPTMTYVLATDEEAYVTPVDDQDRFDVIIVDGEHRRRCAETALGHRSDGGIIVLDNSDWFPDIARRLRSTGLIQVDFAGFGPVQAHAWTTSVFLNGRNPPTQVDDAPRVPSGGTSFSHAMRALVASDPAW